jgi:hypothetical protein
LGTFKIGKHVVAEAYNGEYRRKKRRTYLELHASY